MGGTLVHETRSRKPGTAKIFQMSVTLYKKDKDAGVTFAEHQGYSDRFPIVWTLILNGAAEHAGLQVRAPPHEPRSADVTRAEP